MKSRAWILNERPTGLPDENTFKLKEIDVPSGDSLEDGKVLVKQTLMSLDPAMRGWIRGATYMAPIEIGDIMKSGGIGVVVESKHPDFDKGDMVRASFGWQEYAVCDGNDASAWGMAKVDRSLSPETWMGPLGITGLTAYFGVVDILNVASGETVVVSGAAGATGSAAGQIAKALGARVIGIAGGDVKCEWIKGELGFDDAIDYKSEDVKARLKELCPDGINAYFDNVGGTVLEAVLDNMAMKARIAVCGGISKYNDETPTPGPSNYLNLIMKRAKMEGFLVLDYVQKFAEGRQFLRNLLEKGQLKHKSDITEGGIEKALEAFLRLFQGKNVGKVLLRVSEE